jgi:citrate synthase
LNICLILHAELGGGNNSTFTTQVLSSTGTDTYSVVSSAICSIKGPKHGGANIKAFQMFKDMEMKVADWEDEEQIKGYLRNVINKKEFDKTGLIYGIGHAVFTLSDPRTKILKQMAEMLSVSKHREKEFALYEKVEKMAPQIIREIKKVDKPFCANVDYYTGFIYDMLGIPVELFTPMFVNARIAGWCAHRLEEMCNSCRIIHPAFLSVGKRKEYIKLEKRICNG